MFDARVVHRPGEGQKAPKLLQKAVTSALQAALQQQTSSVALPLLSAGIFGCPVAEAAFHAVKAVTEFLAGLGADSQDYLKVLHQYHHCLSCSRQC